MERRVNSNLFTGSTVILLVFYLSICGQASTDNTTVITCTDYDEDISLYNSHFNIKYPEKYEKYQRVLEIRYCPCPPNTYIDFLNKLNLNTTFEELQLSSISKNIKQLNGEHFIGLNLKVLRIILQENVILTEHISGILNALPNLEMFKGVYVSMPPLSNGSLIKKLHLGYGESVGAFGDCSSLQELILHSWIINSINNHWLTNCTQLTSLMLEKLETRTVLNLLNSARNLQKLTIYKNRITDNIFISHFIANHVQDLVELNLSRNELADFLIAHKFINLQRFNLSDNGFGKYTGYYYTVDLFKMTPKLVELDVSANKDFNICNKNAMFQKPVSGAKIAHLTLERLLLHRTATSNLCIDEVALPSLKYLSWTGNSKIIQFQEFFVSKTSLVVDFNFPDYVLRDIEFTQKDYDILPKFNITLSGQMQLDCDCKQGLLAKALKSKLLSAPFANCDQNTFINHSTPLMLVPAKYIECDKFICGDASGPSSVCDCRRSWKDYSVHVDCRGREVYKIPELQSVSRIDAPYNRIDRLDVPNTVLHLDVTGNRIARMNKDQATALFSNPKRQMKLSENPIVCDCDNRDFIHAMQEHHKQIEDYDNVTCAGGEVFIRNVVTTELCLKLDKEDVITTIVAVVSTLVAVAALVRILYHRYRKIIKIYLYARGWCLCCVREDEIDVDKIYDVFVSFCHEDEILISEELVPQLDALGFKVCVHYRDWIPGELIPTQLVRSIETSRRTVVILSRQFVDSTWGMLEFRTAHVRSLKEGIVRLIVVVIDDVIHDDNLDGEILFYTRTNTYLQWDDPWFWDKLKYALPHKENLATSEDAV